MCVANTSRTSDGRNYSIYVYVDIMLWILPSNVTVTSEEDSKLDNSIPEDIMKICKKTIDDNSLLKILLWHFLYTTLFQIYRGIAGGGSHYEVGGGWPKNVKL